MDQPVARVGGIDISADQAVTLLNLASSANAAFGAQPTGKPKRQSTVPEGPAGKAFGAARRGLAHVVRMLTEIFALEYRPWFQFIDITKFRKPADTRAALRDCLTNLRYWAYNYAMLSLVVFVYSLLTNPVLILTFFASGACWVWLTMVRKEPVVVCGRVVNQHQLLYALLSLSAVAFVITQGYRTLVWSMILSSILILAHAWFRVPEYTALAHSELDSYDYEMQSAAAGGPDTGIALNIPDSPDDSDDAAMARDSDPLVASGSSARSAV